MPNYEKTNRIRVSVSPWEKDAFAKRLVREEHVRAASRREVIRV
jgi:hypothetical protein